MRSLPGLAAFVGIALVVGCAPGTRTVAGECQDVFGADICTWGTLAGNEVVEFGATIPLAAIEGAPANAQMVWPPAQEAAISLPAEVREATGFNYLGVNWEAQGHPPTPWLTPHFDFHFYSETPAQIAAIDCSNLNKPAALADGYALPDIAIPELGTLVGLCVPAMGMHSARTSELGATEPFGASMIVGYYDQSLIFVEPMISRAKLMAEQSFTMDVPAVPDAGDVITWPQGFEAVYDAQARAYRFVFRTAETDGS